MNTKKKLLIIKATNCDGIFFFFHNKYQNKLRKGWTKKKKDNVQKQTLLVVLGASHFKVYTGTRATNIKPKNA